MPELTTAQRREFPRVSFEASAVVIDSNAVRVVVGRTTSLSRFGCFIETMSPQARGTRVYLELCDGKNMFRVFGRVAYLAVNGMGIAFGLVEAENHNILDKWLSQCQPI